MVSKQLVSCTFPGIPACHSEFILEKNRHGNPNSLGPGKVQKLTEGGRSTSATERLEKILRGGSPASSSHRKILPQRGGDKTGQEHWNYFSFFLSAYSLPSRETPVALQSKTMDFQAVELRQF